MNTFLKRNSSGWAFIKGVADSNNQIIKNAKSGFFLPGTEPGEEHYLIEENNKTILDASLNQIKENKIAAEEEDIKMNNEKNSFSHQLEGGMNDIKNFLSAGVDQVSDILGISDFSKYLMMFAGAVLLVLLLRR